MSPSVEAFYEAKYQALMDGLECNEILLSDIGDRNPGFRIDAEYFNKESERIETVIRSHPHYYINRDQVVSGPFGSTLKSESYLSSGDVPFVRIENIRGGFYINSNDIVYISSADNERIKNSELNLDDVILSKVGNTIGFFARVDERLSICNISENNIGIKMSCYPVSQRKYILTYLNTKYAQKLVWRRISGNAQPKLNVGDVSLIPIPAFSDELYEHVSDLVDTSETMIVKAETKYRKAEVFLASYLNFNIEEQERPVKAIKNFKCSFASTGRLDAEYYQPKYDALFDSLAHFNCKTLGGDGGIVRIKKSIEPGSEAYQEEGVPFVRVSDVDRYEISTTDVFLDHNIVPDIESLYPKKDTILFSKDGSVGIAYKVEEDGQFVTSGALLHLIVRDTKEVLPDYLTLVLNSPIVQMQAERDSNGAIIQHWKPSEIEQVVIPVLDMPTQEIIAAKVQESFALRRKSKELLEYAKQAVEMAIEQGEAAAMDWLKSKVD